jgi:hypothetical protein
VLSSLPGQWEVTARVLHHEYVATSFWSFLSDPASSLASTTQSAQLQRLVGAICTADFVLLGYLLSDFPPPRSGTALAAPLAVLAGHRPL